MLPAIELDNQTPRKTNEIHNETPQRLLPAKFVARESFCPELLPQRMFGRCFLPAQFARAPGKPASARAGVLPLSPQPLSRQGRGE